MRAGKVDHVEKESSAEPDENRKYAHFTHSAIFAEVKIDEELDVTPRHPRGECGRRRTHSQS